MINLASRPKLAAIIDPIAMILTTTFIREVKSSWELADESTSAFSGGARARVGVFISLLYGGHYIPCIIRD